MTTVSISFEPLKRYAQISIDGDHISPYSDLASCENKDLHVCGMRMLKLLDEEIGTEYEIEILGSRFQIDMLTALAESSDLCVSVHGAELQLAFSMDDTFNFAVSLEDKFNLGIERNTNVCISGDLSEQVHSAYAIKGEPTEVYVVDVLPDVIEKGKTVLLASDHYDIRNVHGINIVEVPSVAIDSFIDYYHCYTKVIPFIDAVFSQSKYATLTQTEGLLLDAFSEQTPKYIFTISKTTLDVAETTGFQFIVLPESASDMYQMTIDRPGAVSIRNNELLAIEDGTVIISILTNTGKVCESKQLSISKHSYVDSIRLIPSVTSIEVGKKGQIDAYILPENAEDAHSLNWTSSNTDIVHVTTTGEFVALKPGTAVITVSSVKCNQQVSIKVCPSLERISLSKSSLTVQVGASDTITCNLYPSDAAHSELIWELSNDGMGTIDVRDSGTTCSFTATTSSLAKGSIKCRVKGTEKTASCAIEIVPEERPTGLITCAMVFSIIGLCASFLIPLIWFGGGGISGFFADFFLPIGIILCLIGRAKTENKEKIFGIMLKLDIIFTIVMFFFAIVCCSPR